MTKPFLPEEALSLSYLNSKQTLVSHPVLRDTGFMVLPEFLDVSPYRRPEMEPGFLLYGDLPGDITWDPQPEKKNFSCYSDPALKSLFFEAKRKVEKIIDAPLYPTYHLDRIYYEGGSMHVHVDRPACEISLSVLIRTNIKESWPLWALPPISDKSEIELGDENLSKAYPATLKPGDALLYRGCDVIHYREPLVGETTDGEPPYSHHVFFHYVLQNGKRTEFAYDVNHYGATRD